MSCLVTSYDYRKKLLTKISSEGNWANPDQALESSGVSLNKGWGGWASGGANIKTYATSAVVCILVKD